MVGYIFETTNKKTGEKYLGKRYGVVFDKKFLGNSDDVAIAIEKYGRPTFEVKMLMPYESLEMLDAAFKEMTEASKKEEPKAEEPEVEASAEEPVEEVVKETKPRGRKKKIEE